MNLGRVRTKEAVVGLAVLIVAGGIVVGLVSYGVSPVASGNMTHDGLPGPSSSFGSLGLIATSGSNIPQGATEVVGQGSAYAATTTVTALGTATTQGTAQSQTPGNVTQGGAPGSGSIEFSSQVALQSASPQGAASDVVALAYSVGGYVAYQSTYQGSANVVIRVPEASYQMVLAKVESFGTVESLTSNSNDVSVQYTNLNATFVSLQTEQAALLRLLNVSTSINSTLAIETQLQGVNQQINEVESQILQTRTLIAYSTINMTISESAQAAPLSMVLTATPKSGEAPLSVTFNAVVKGGAQPYVVNYNFGDGYASQGQIVIHTYFDPGFYNVTVTATDQNGTSVERSTMVHVSAAPGTGGFQGFAATVSGLFISVVEGMAEVAVVLVPIAAVGAAVIYPIRRRARNRGPKPE